MRTPKKHVGKTGRVTWQVRFRPPDSNRQTTKTFRTERAARVFCRDLDARGPAFALEMAAPDGRHEQAPEAQTLEELAAEFFTWKEARVRSDRTVADYRRDWRLWIAPTFGHLTPHEVTPAAVQQWVDDMHTGDLDDRRPASPKSVAGRHFVLHAVLDWALTRGLAPDNPTTGTNLPKRRKTPPKGLRQPEWAALRAALADIDPDGCDLADFLLASGWRWSEATALCVYDVEDIDGVLHATMGRVWRRNAAGQHVLLEDGKAAASMRRTALDAETAAMVRRRVLAAQPGGLVFTNRRGNRWLSSNYRSRIWDPAVKAANLTTRKPTPHSLRHTHVQWMLTSGAATLPEVQARIGHASITTTVGVYGRLITDVRPDALTAFAQVRAGTPTKKARAAQRRARKTQRAAALTAV